MVGGWERWERWESMGKDSKRGAEDGQKVTCYSVSWCSLFTGANYLSQALTGAHHDGLFPPPTAK